MAIRSAKFAVRPRAVDWSQTMASSTVVRIDMPNSNTSRYRGAAACGMYKIGGSSGGFNATVDSEMLPGFEDCGSSAADVEWMTVSPAVAMLAPGQSVTVTVTMDPNVAQPGTYTAAVGIAEDAPGSIDPVAVTFDVTPPKDWGKMTGTVTGTSCAGATAPIPGATVQVNAGAQAWTFETEADGGYAYWFSTDFNPLQVIAAKDGYQPTVKTVRLKRGETVTADFALMRAGC